ncbi:MAG: shikimate kinase [Flavobacteriales bacterium]
MKVFLIGYMASGKTTIGEKLAAQLKVDFIDLDQFIESQEKKSISAIFNDGGEALFRGVEMKCLKETIQLPGDYVISTGGGTPCFYDNMKDMNEGGLTIYLEMDAKSITYRLVNFRGDRPLVNDISEEELLEFVEQQMEERKYYYAEAKMKVSAFGFTDASIQKLANRVHTYAKLN